MSNTDILVFYKNNELFSRIFIVSTFKTSTQSAKKYFTHIATTSALDKILRSKYRQNE